MGAMVEAVRQSLMAGLDPAIYGSLVRLSLRYRFLDGLTRL